MWCTFALYSAPIGGKKNELIAATIIASFAHTNRQQFDNNNENINEFCGASFALYSAPISGKQMN